MGTCDWRKDAILNIPLVHMDTLFLAKALRWKSHGNVWH